MQHKWPTYEVADDAVVYAIGVVSINYARFERTHTWMTAAVGNMKEAQAALVIARMNASDRTRLIEAFMQRAKWPDEALAAIKHYLKAMELLVKNRNILIHSNVIRGTDNRAAIYSMTRQGTYNRFQATLEEVRQVADDLDTYFYFGLGLANYIATEIHAMAREAGMLAISMVPNLPPLPVHIDPAQRSKG
jgi:hypothetical protein